MSDDMRSQYETGDSYLLPCSFDEVCNDVQKTGASQNNELMENNLELVLGSKVKQEKFLGTEESLEDGTENHSFSVKKNDDGFEIYYCHYCEEEYMSLEEINAAHFINYEDHIQYDEEQQWQSNDENTETSMEQGKDLILATQDEVSEEEPEFEDVSIIDIEQVVKSEAHDDADDCDKFLCEECDTVFDDLEVAQQHNCPAFSTKSNSINEESFPCSDCSTEFKSADELKKHSETNHLESPQYCDYCDKQFVSLRALYRHYFNDHRVKGPFRCQKCLKCFKTIQLLLNHAKNVCKTTKNAAVSDSNKPVKCEICNTQISSARSLKFHMKIHQSKAKKSIQDVLPASSLDQYRELNQFFCEICNKSFDQNLLQVHKNMHQNVEEHSCSICNRQFKNQTLYEMHLQLHLRQKTSYSRYPMRTEGSNGEKLNHICQYCGRAFGKPYEKVKHERIHTGEKPYECEVCGKCFRTSYSLTIHLRSHTDIRPFVCPTCNKRFKSKSAYSHHLRSHEEEKSYKCDICPKAFRTSVRLNAHRNSHLKPFSCPTCGKRFASLHSTKTHMKVHNKLNNNDNADLDMQEKHQEIDQEIQLYEESMHPIVETGDNVTMFEVVVDDQIVQMNMEEIVVREEVSNALDDNETERATQILLQHENYFTHE